MTDRLRKALPWQQLWLPVLLLLVLGLLPMPLTTRLELLAYDSLSRSALPASNASHSVIIAIDDASLQKYGPWPWPRQRYAEVLKTLRAAQSGPVALDILLQSSSRNPAGDEALANQMAQGGTLILPVLPAISPTGQGMVALQSSQLLRRHAIEAHADVEIDPDGLTRRIFLEAGIDSQWWPALALAMLKHADPTAAPLPNGRQPADPRQSKPGIWQRDHELLLRNDRVGNIPLIPYASLMAGEVPAATLRGKSIFVGVTASGANSALSMANTHSGGMVPAVEYQARVYEALRQGAVVIPAGRLTLLSIGLALLLAATFVSRRLSHLWSLSLLSLGLLPALVSMLLIHLFKLWTSPIAATLALIAFALACAWRKIVDFDVADSHLRQQTDVAMDSIADGVIVIGNDGRIEQANSASARLLHQPPAKLCGQLCGNVLGVSEQLLQGIHDCLQSGQPILLAEALDLPVEPPCTVRVSIGPLSAKGASARGAVLVLSDVTPLVVAENRLKHQATHDPLTGLPNRTLIQDRLDQLLVSMQRRHLRVVVLFLDLDRFKWINDGAGHPVGDEVLRTISQRLRNSCRVEDTVGRWGGDEFVILLTGDEVLKQAQLVARKLVDEIAEPISIDGATYTLGASIGIALAPTDSDKSEELVRLADLAMYRAKVAGGNRFAFVSPDMNRNSSQRLALESDLRKALKKGEFELYYQPQVAIDNHRLTGLEALIRWNRPGIGLVPPDQFIPIAEESGLINDIGAWVLDDVGRQIAQWRDAGAALVPVAVNVSVRQCQDLALVEQIRETLNQHDIPPRLLEIEITETAAVQNLEHMSLLLGELDRLGVKLAIDDFGTGYSSLAHLKSLPISVLKIDKSFVDGTPENHEDASISRATIALAHSLGMTVIAEGVENEPQRAFLDHEACDIAQGFLFSRPVPAAAMLQILQATDGRIPGAPPAPGLSGQ